jgi:hypothetical protein
MNMRSTSLAGQETKRFITRAGFTLTLAAPSAAPLRTLRALDDTDVWLSQGKERRTFLCSCNYRNAVLKKACWLSSSSPSSSLRLFIAIRCLDGNVLGKKEGKPLLKRVKSCNLPSL